MTARRNHGALRKARDLEEAERRERALTAIVALKVRNPQHVRVLAMHNAAKQRRAR